jgi:hypothetical protein
VLDLFVGEADERAYRVVVAEHLRLRVLHGQRDDVLLDEPEQVEVRVARDLVQLPRIVRREEAQVAAAGERRRENGRVKSRRVSGGITSSSFQATFSELRPQLA